MYIAIDIGGTKTLLAIFSKNGRLKKRLKMKSWQEPEKWVQELGKNLSRILPLRKKSIKAVTISYPGVLENNTPKKAVNLPLWDGKKIAEDVKNLFSSKKITVPIFYKNDADLGALYECRNFSGKTLYLTFGTGIGGGIIKNGKLTSESASFEPGHLKKSYQGKRLDWEKIASSKAIRTANNDLDVRKIREKTALDDVACRFSVGLVDLIKEHGPDQIVLSGPIIEVFSDFKNTLHKLLETNLKFEPPKIYPAKHPQESVIYGAYLYGKSKNS